MSGTHYPEIQQPGFALDVRHWPTVAAFRAYLAGYDYRTTAPWARGCIVHHTYRPLAADWRGPASMAGLARHYALTNGWSAGPHLFIAAGSPNPLHDGIWQLTPLDRPGIHGNDANGWTWGIEHVGDFDRVTWPPDLAALGCGAMAVLLDWASLPASPVTLQPHRIYNPSKSCPGRALDMEAVRRGVAVLQQPVTRFTFTADSLLISPSPLPSSALERALVKRCARGHYPPDAVAALASLYAGLERAVGVNAWLAAAQMCHETGNLTSGRSRPPQHNLAGIGATNDGAQGAGFPDLATAVRAQIGRLLAYAMAPGERFGPQVQLVDEALRWRALPLQMHGSAPRIKALGAAHNPTGQGWAYPGDGYGAAVAAVANALLEAGRG